MYVYGSVPIIPKFLVPSRASLFHLTFEVQQYPDHANDMWRSVRNDLVSKLQLRGF